MLCSATWGAQAFAQTTLNEVVVNGQRIQELGAGEQLDRAAISAQQAITRDTANLLRDVPGVSLYGAGGVSSLPAIHGLADDRLRISVDGMDFVASCPNHMNPPLSYLDPSHVAKIKVYAGIAPVSVGGDSIGGAIVAETAPPEFARSSEQVLTKGEAGVFVRSNNNAQGGNLAVSVASESTSLSYSGAFAKADNYRAGSNFKSSTATGRVGHTVFLDEVASTAYESKTHTLGFAMRGEGHLLEAKLGYQNVPYQLYPNQRMDMLDNEQQRLNLRYLGQFAWGQLDARAYQEKVDHFMDFGADKRMWYGTASGGSGVANGNPCTPISATCAYGMPMYTASRTSGVNVKADIDWGDDELLRLGALYQSYALNDWWPPSGSGMWPGTFDNIKDGQRDRLGIFGEWEGRLSSQWTGLLGARYERVLSNAGNVQGYNTAVGAMGNQVVDATAFNSQDRARRDHNVDLTALARHSASATLDMELGLARKVRSPNLYERYTWSTWSMAAVMNNFVGDGNGYIGNPDLKPEKAYTASVTLDWHDAERTWGLKATPYYTYVVDYIDAVRCSSGSACTVANSSTSNQFVTLRYANQNARLYGLDLSGHMDLGHSAYGVWGLKGVLNYTKGENQSTGGNLYNIMPLNVKLTLSHQYDAWASSLEVVGVQKKSDVSAVRNEIATGGYGLLNLRSSYSWRRMRLDVGVENLFNKFYYLPLGGAYTGQGTTMSINGIPWGIAVPGMGRSLYAGVTVTF